MPVRFPTIRTLIVVLLGAIAAVAGPDVGLDTALKQLMSVGSEGRGNTTAAAAWRQVTDRGIAAMLPALNALDRADPRAANWLRAAIETVAERQLAEGDPLPTAELEAFVRDASHNPRARRLAFEWLCRADPTAPDRLLPGMLDDPSVELRREAVARVITEAEHHVKNGDSSQAIRAFRLALTGARDRDQVENIAKRLRSLGQEVDLSSHFGFIRQWHLIGPFEHAGGVGFDAVYPPEKGIDLDEEYRGKGGKKVAWKSYRTSNTYGIVDLNKALGKSRGAVAYAYAVVHSPVARPVEVRVGSNNAVKIFLNGRLLLAHEEYHHGMNMDQYVGRGQLRRGRNSILLKVCQNEQKEPWAQKWSFQLRLCDSVGGAVPVTVEDVRITSRDQVEDQ